MKIELKASEVATILGVIHSEYINKKVYFKEYPDEVEGLVTPEELRETFNSILKQAQSEGDLSFLEPIKNTI